MLIKLMILAAAAATMTTTAAAASKAKSKTKTVTGTVRPSVKQEAPVTGSADRLFEPTAESYGMDYMYV
ncbi:MAG: hypothetical protein II118_05380 [Ruminococcus sp.]|jgi:hypothetical protein|nr:hypothetical protein [Ruminococcus sp.]MBQ1381361.1 hypothetical protein [Ruminococcus sp.]MBQ1639066.1 hypothetical protein [Ruminococcus sp.]MBQ1814285.1 hypothetical protein [Ruminococcus sp.]MBQ2569060.1 hypothetical protein [Ruminococcus sp.]